MILSLGGSIGVVAIGLAVVAYWGFRDTNYRRILLPIIVAMVVFTLAHVLLVLWPSHPPIVDALEPLSFTVLAFGVLRLVSLHPDVIEVTHGGRR